MVEQCSGCAFARLAGSLRCHRYAPEPGGSVASWPSVNDTDWCGEYEAKPCRHEWFDTADGVTCIKCGAVQLRYYAGGV